MSSGGKIAELDLQLMHLQAVRKTLSNHQQNMSTLLTMDLSEIRVVEKQERCLVTVDIDRDTTFEKKVELITAQTSHSSAGASPRRFLRFHDSRCKPPLRQF